MTSLGGFQFAADSLFASTANFEFGGAVSSLRLTGSTANQYMFGDNPSGMDAAAFNDPTDDMINAIRELAFRTSLRAADDNATLLQSGVPFVGSLTHPIYVTDFRYMVGAALLGLLGILAICPTFYGWWKLGREVSWSPLEIAKAFDAPLLRDVDSNATADQLVRQLDRKRVRYGEMRGVHGGGERMLAIAEAANVGPVSSGAVYNR